MGRLRKQVAASAASVSLSHTLQWPCCVFSHVQWFPNCPSAQQMCLYCFPCMEFCINPSPLQHITSLAHVFSPCPSSTCCWIAVCFWLTDSIAQVGLLSFSWPLVMIPSFCLSLVQLAAIYVMLQWIMLWLAHTPHKTAFTPRVCSIGHQQCLLHPKSSSSSHCCLPVSLSPFPVWCAVKTAVKHSLISPAISLGNSNEKILPTFSFSCHATRYKCWQETAVPSLTFYRALRIHTYTHNSYYWQCLWISRVWDGVKEFNDTQCRFDFSAPWPGYQVHHLSFIQRRVGGLSGP